VPAMTPATFPSTAAPMFDQKITVNNPTLWYPNNSTFGTPYLYRVYHIISVNGVVVDSAQSNLGIRLITWDHNFPYFNGHAMYLWGGSGRYDYPALGSSVPEEPRRAGISGVRATRAPARSSSRRPTSTAS
jgi:beta-galactosidase